MDNCSSAFALPSSVGAQRCYPAHDPPFPQFGSLNVRNQLEFASVVTENHNDQNEHMTRFGPINVENQLELSTIVTDNHDQDEHITHGSTPNSGTLSELVTSAGISNNSTEEPRNYRNTVWHALTDLFITFVQMFGSPNGQNQRELPIIATEHPNDDENISRPVLSQLCDFVRYMYGLALNNGTLPERVTGVGILNNSTEENPNFPNPVGDEEEGEVEVEVEVEGEGVSGDDPSIRGIIGQQTTRWKVPIVAPFALRVVLCLVIVFFGVKQGEHIAKLFKLLFVVGSGVAFATYSIISWISDRSDYKMLKGIYHVGCNLAFISVLLIIYTTT